MDAPAVAPSGAARVDLARLVRTYGPWAALLLLALLPRLYLLRVFDVELSNDGFDAVNTLTLLQTQGPAAIPQDLIDRFILHPLYMLLLFVLRILTPESFDFYVVARLASSLLACLAVVVMFLLVRRAFGVYAAGAAALLLAFAPTFLWEGISILSSALFLLLYLAVLAALVDSRYRLAAFLAFLSAITRYEGIVLVLLVLAVLFVRDLRARRLDGSTWAVCLALSLAVPLTTIASGAVTTGNAFEFLGAQSMASLWLRFLAPGDFAKRASFFLTQYPALFPLPVVCLGLVGAAAGLLRARPANTLPQRRTTALLFLTTGLYLVFFLVLVWFNYTTLEVRFLMYPGLPLLVFAGVALGVAYDSVARCKSARLVGNLALGSLLIVLLGLSYQQGVAGMQFLYNMQASQREVAEELARYIPPHQRTNAIIYAGVSGALDLYARQRGLDLAFTYFRYAPDDQPERYLIDRKVQFVVYPVGNAFASAKYPYLARFETTTRGGVTFQPLEQFSTSTDNQLYSLWSVTY